MQIGTALADARKAAGISQRALAGQLRISPSYLCDLEMGKRSFPLARVKDLPESIRRDVANAMLAEHDAVGTELKKWAY